MAMRGVLVGSQQVLQVVVEEEQAKEEEDLGGASSTGSWIVGEWSKNPWGLNVTPIVVTGIIGQSSRRTTWVAAMVYLDDKRRIKRKLKTGLVKSVEMIEVE